MVTRENLTLRKIIFTSLCIVINIIGGLLALAFRLPIYLDTIGTITSALLLGPLYGFLAGTFSGIINGIVFDPTSFYYIPVQMVIGLLTGLLFKEPKFNGFVSILKIIIITLSGTIISSLITAFVFSGITSSGSSYIVAALRGFGVNLFHSVFSTQLVSDLLDKGLSFLIAFLIIRSIPAKYRTALNR